MTEADWPDGDDPAAMLAAVLATKPGDRKLRLFACACVRLVRHRLPKGLAEKVVGLAERFADGEATAREMSQAWSAWAFGRNGDSEVGWAARRTLNEKMALYIAEVARDARSADWRTADGQCDALRCVFGNPFPPVTIDRRWLTSNVADLARAIYDERGFERLPILADALMDAGCDDEQLLGHCRSEGPHVRGCWVVDLLLGKR